MFFFVLDFDFAFFFFCVRIYVQATPLLGIMGIAIAGVTAYCIYAMVTKNDVM